DMIQLITRVGDAGFELAERLGALQNKTDLIARWQEELKSIVAEGLSQLSRQGAEIRSAVRQNQAAPAATRAEPSNTNYRYQLLRQKIGQQQFVEQLRKILKQALPANAIVLVVSKGDDVLLELDGVKAWHFPQTDDGFYAGHHPADSTEAIAHLQAL